MSSLTSLVPFEWFEIRSNSRSPQLRVGHSSTFIPTLSNIYLLGGANPSECFADIHSLSLPSATSESFVWTKLVGEDPALRRYEHSAISSSENNDQIVFFGGANTENNFNDVHVFNISTKTIEDWTPKDTKLVSPRTHHSSCCIQNGLYIFSGGFQGVKAVDDAELYRFDLVSRTWSCVPAHGSPPEQRHGHCIMSLGNSRLYLHGGMDGRTFYSSLYSLDINENPPRWKEHSSSTSSAHPMARAAHGAVSIESTSTLFIFGGLSRSGQAFNDTWSWSQTNEQWTEILCRSLPRARLDFAYCLVEYQDESKQTVPCLFVHGGTDTQGETDREKFTDIEYKINWIYAKTEGLSCKTFLENCGACLTGYLFLLCIPMHHEKCIKRAARFISEGNDRTLNLKGIIMVDPMEKGLCCTEVCITNNYR